MAREDPIIIALSGRKGSGKNTVAKFIASHYEMNTLSPGNVLECSFADNIKTFCIETLGLSREQCYGSDDQKNAPTQYLWENVRNSLIRRKFGLSSGPMTGREIMQLFGTELVRESFGNVWADATIRKIKHSEVSLAIITDNRFPNEVESVLSQPNGYIIRLTRSSFGTYDGHPSEISLDDYSWDRPSCFVLHNAKMTIRDQNKAVIPILESIFNTENQNEPY